MASGVDELAPSLCDKDVGAVMVKIGSAVLAQRSSWRTLNDMHAQLVGIGKISFLVPFPPVFAWIGEWVAGSSDANLSSRSFG
ncbi:hypothetical protein MB02_14025 [Croceicoccus estronivorus]|uniref:hypothetical protein n=1 Tax=Croceicoccus estronivorus TaxID=1172626 RepID=UPI0008332DCF|nr:hypothetical protein [Croceicoccus estronivorus]OCC22886.1 hypothetical protein MB02_14025 [Croceicoccus estronivorus]